MEQKPYCEWNTDRQFQQLTEILEIATHSTKLADGWCMELSVSSEVFPYLDAARVALRSATEIVQHQKDETMQQNDLRHHCQFQDLVALSKKNILSLREIKAEAEYEARQKEKEAIAFQLKTSMDVVNQIITELRQYGITGKIHQGEPLLLPVVTISLEPLVFEIAPERLEINEDYNFYSRFESQSFLGRILESRVAPQHWISSVRDEGKSSTKLIDVIDWMAETTAKWELFSEENTRKLAEYEAIKEVVEAKISELKTPIWNWPEGKTVDIYLWQWHSGFNEDGEAEYDMGWGKTSEVINGEIELFPELFDAKATRKTRYLRLFDASFSTTRYEVSATEHLPPTLKVLSPELDETVSAVFLEGYRKVLAFDSEGNITEIYLEDKSSSIEIYEKTSEVPIAWIRDLVDQKPKE